MSSADPDRACLHENFVADVAVGRLYATDDHSGFPDAFVAEVRVVCAACDEPFRFRCLDAGLLMDRPTVSPDEAELRVPIRPASSDPDFGLGLPGFAVRMREWDTR